jgi:hypothetical protein
MKSTGVKSIVEHLQLAPPEERLLKRIVYPNPPGRLTSFFQRKLRLKRPWQGSKGVILALLLGLGVGLLGWVVSLIESSLYDSEREFLPTIALIAFLMTLFVRDRMALQKRLIKKLYSSLEQGHSTEQHRTAEQ